MDGRSTKRRAAPEPERRIDSIKGFEVILAPARFDRPGAIQLEPWPDKHALPCPFCRGHEDELPESISCFPSATNWRIKIVPNKYPAFVKGTPPRDCRGTDGLPHPGHELPAHGLHEVVIESADHVCRITELPVTTVAELLAVVQQRFIKLRDDGQVTNVIFFKNCGPAAGASLPHVHSQLVGLPYTPSGLQQELRAAERYHLDSSHCFLCDRLAAADRANRKICDTLHFRLFAPWASRFPYETWIAPRKHNSHFDRATPAEVADLAAALHAHLARLEQALPHVCYNLLLHSSPFDTRPNDHYHWHFAVIPRIAMLAGFELATGQFLNFVDPATAAERLKPAR